MSIVTLLPLAESPADDPPGSPLDESPDSLRKPGWSERLLTAAIVAIPLLAVALAGSIFWNHGIGWFDLILAATLFVVTGHGLALGFHRLFTHRSFVAHRWLRIGLAVAGTMGFEGSVISWVAHHRRHHVYADRPGDPHSPVVEGAGVGAQIRGLGHAHMGWLFCGTQSNAERWSRDLLADRDIVIVSALTPVWMGLSLALPFALGYLVMGTFTGALLALLWAGVVRIFLLHHVTWSVNSLGHTFGAHPYRTKDRSGNIGLLALLSFGDSWHNTHHAFPALARHGCDPGQLDSSARLLWVFEKFGWATEARWPRPEQLAARRTLR